DHMLASAAGATEHAVTRLDAFDHPAVVAVGTKSNSVARRHNVPLIGGERLEQLPYGAGVDLSIIAQHPAAQAMHTDDAAEVDQPFMIAQPHLQTRGLLGIGISTDHGSLPRQLAFAADTFTAGGILEPAEILLASQFTGEISDPCSTLRVFAKRGAEFCPLLCHERCLTAKPGRG